MKKKLKTDYVIDRSNKWDLYDYVFFGGMFVIGTALTVLTLTTILLLIKITITNIIS